MAQLLKYVTNEHRCASVKLNQIGREGWICPSGQVYLKPDHPGKEALPARKLHSAPGFITGCTQVTDRFIC